MAANDILLLDASLRESQKDRAPHLSESDYFEIFAAEQVLKDFQLSDDELESGRVGGSNDGGLDGLYFLVNRQLVSDDTEIDPRTVTRADLVLIQATREPSFNETRVGNLYLLTEDLLDLSRWSGQLAGTYNLVLQAAIARFKEKYKTFLHIPHDFSISYYYVSKGDKNTINVALQRRADRVTAKAS